MYLSQSTEPFPKVVHFVSDGPTTQYRNKHNFFLFSTRIFDKGFKRGTWNFTEAGHGKGPADGIGAVVKRTADKMVHTNRADITCANDLMNALKATNIQTYLVTDKDINNIEKLIPEGVQTVSQTMKIHQIIVGERGVVNSRKLSCFCDPNCDCYEPISTRLASNDIHVSDSSQGIHVDVSTVGLENVPETGDSLLQQARCSENTDPELVPVETVDDELIGRYCVVVYDELPYPGLILDVDSDDEVEVKVMCRVGPNRFFWPLIEDRLWYPKDRIVTLLNDEPPKVTNRHCQIESGIWRSIVKKLDLDNHGKKNV